MNDRRIIELFFARDEAALDRLREKYGRYLMSIALSILRSERDAEECVNDAYMRVWNSVPPNDPPDLRAYAGAVCRKHALNMLDRTSALKRGGGGTDAAYDELAEILSGCDDFTEEVALRDVLNRFLGSLSRRARVIFVQKYWYMRSVSEISADLHLSESAVKSSLLRTREKLAEFLRKEGFEL